ncbi:hypothetical protein SARC_06605 [Sphaeroforma arctica JP610]|uniref:Agd3 deacetylase domain-containing protein n=1 Tax=Sphaeroforma arctica JP610 TaxID=667725 RepID=A0A0L0FYP7_9EUKA|nr:hypothetical protein SARC_06605 [Sphaeroforma arctica JP610]KNC81063.1 hypothetical protein SARC_06605 [Sphaeroforma arctica JP610]|eukprot:XP_014154965.1 hypothetical protein SARC_06605 [Sphaeroforma arctica JP610]
MLTNTLVYFVALVTPLVGRMADAAPASGDFELPLKALVLVTKAELASYPEWILDSMQMPYDMIYLIDEATSKPSQAAQDLHKYLYDTAGNPMYNSVVLENLQLGYVAEVEGEEVFQSVLDAETWDAIDEMCRQYKLRKVVLASSSLADEALIPYPGLERGSSEDALIEFYDSDYAKSLLLHIKQDSQFVIGQVSEFVRTIYWYYPATLASDATHIKPFMKMKPSCAGTNEARVLQLTQAANSDTPCKDIEWVGGFTMEKNGVEEMHFLVNSNIYGQHGFVVSDIWFTWMTRGVWPGMRRVPLNTQVDDFFLATGVYNSTLDRQALAEEPVYRTSGTDIELLTQWQDMFNEGLPENSRYVMEIAFNGAGWFDFADFPDSCNPVTIEKRDHFFWVSHTWRHLDMYCPFSDCATYGLTAYEDVKFELEKNKWMAENELFFDINDQDLATYPTWSAKSLVTPRISGLNHTESIRAMSDLGITSAVGDNSRLDLMPDNPWHGFLTKVADESGRRIFVIPRYATRVYFDVSLPLESEMEHASIYGPNCYGNQRTEEVTHPWKCNIKTFKYTRDLDITEILSIEAYETGRNLLAYRTDPYMFHQANLRFFEYEGRVQSLITMWIEAVAGEFLKYKDLPLFSLKQDDLREFYQQRMDRDDCNISAKWVYKGNKPVELKVTGDKDCEAKLTRVESSEFTFVDAASEEHYGFDRTRDIPIKKNVDTVLTVGPASADNKQQAPLPYPPAVRPVTDYDRRDDANSFGAFQSVAATEVFALEKYLKDLLVEELKFVQEYRTQTEAATCRPSNDTLDETYFTKFGDMSLPAAEARNKNKKSWYRTMEEEQAQLESELTAKSTEIDDATPATVVDTIKKDISSSVSNMEDWGTGIHKQAYESLRTIATDYSAKGAC